jgi:formiminotetrahydrofolate cyclodeaminase
VNSVWQEALSAFAGQVASKQPAPAGVAAAAVAAALAVNLLIKVLAISGRRADLAERARRIETGLRAAADEDAAIVQRLIGERDPAAMREAIEIPIRAARLAAEALEACRDAAPELSGHLAADLAAAAALLEGSARGILACVEANLRIAPDETAADRVRELRGRVDATASYPCR